MKYTTEIFGLIKETLEIGGAFVVDEAGYVRDKEGELVTLTISKKLKPIMVFNPNMKTGEHTIINPLVDNIASTVERTWYFNTLSRICGGLTHTVMDAVITRVIAEMGGTGGSDLSSLESFSDIAKHVDKKLLKECEKLHASNILKIYYSATKHIAQAQTDLDDISYMEDVKVDRKRSWGIFQTLLSIIMDTDIEELGAKFNYKSKHIGFGKIDAMLHLYVMVLEQLHPFVLTFLPEEYHYNLGNIIAHLDNLKAYNKDCCWFAGGTAVKKIEEEPEETAPWQQPGQQSWQQPVPQMQQPQSMMQQPPPPQPGMMMAMPITAAVQAKPFHQQPTMQYPGYGQTMQQPQQAMQMNQYQQQPQGMMQQPQGMMQQPMMQQPQGMMQQPMMQQQGMYPGMQQQPGMMMQPNAMMRPPAPINTQPMLSHGSAVEEIKYNKGSSGINYKS